MSTNTHPALELKLRRGGKQGAALEILDASGRPVALILEGAQAEALAQLLLASPDLLWGIARSLSYLEDTASATPEQRKICKLLHDIFGKATRAPQR